MKFKWLFSPWVIGGALIVGLFSSVGYARSYLRDRAIDQEIAMLKESQDQLERKKTDLSTLFQKVEGDEYAESHAREQLGLHDVGEKSVVIEPIHGETGIQGTGAIKKESPTNLQKWWHYFFVHE